MTIDEILSPDQVAVGVRTASKAALLDDLARRAAHALGLDAASVRTALEKREGLGSTGVGDGIALPHARLETVRRPFGALVRLRDAVDFDAIDERPVDLVFLLLLPNDAQGSQLNALACVARRMRDPEAAAAMRGARDAGALFATMRGIQTAP
jgi:PTS system nitrogen regulatory IIA component